MFDFLKKKASFADLGFTSECHCHVLPGVDDGAKSIKESMVILRGMIRMGFRSIVLTPHINPDVYPGNNEAQIKKLFHDFVSALPEDITSALDISLGAEYMVTAGFEDSRPSSLLQFLPGKVLIEMSYLYPSKNVEDAIFNLVMSGITPVVAHPERYLYYAQKRSIFERFHDMGAEFQMNALSLSGAYGYESMSILEYLLSKGWYTHIGTDTHGISHLQNLYSMHFNARLLEPCKNILK